MEPQYYLQQMMEQQIMASLQQQLGQKRLASQLLEQLLL
jgi:hypothetical protein